MTSDYASFGYLDDEPAAFARFPLAQESGRVPAYDGGFDAATVARAEMLLAEHVVVSLHDHPVGSPPTWRSPRSTTAPAVSTPRSTAWRHRA